MLSVRNLQEKLWSDTGKFDDFKFEEDLRLAVRVNEVLRSERNGKPEKRKFDDFRFEENFALDTNE